MSTCKKSCCWTPYSCARQSQCACHTGHQRIIDRLTPAELQRATAISKTKVGRR